MQIKTNEEWSDVLRLQVRSDNRWKSGEVIQRKAGVVWETIHTEQHILTYQIRVGYFYAPQLWYGFFRDGDPDPGTVSPNTFNEWAVRDFNSPVDNQLRFQFGLFGGPLYTNITHVEVGTLGKLPFDTVVKDAVGGVVRHYFTDGVTNVHQYLGSMLGQVITIKLYFNK